jgi:hypothetical protein
MDTIEALEAREASSKCLPSRRYLTSSTGPVFMGPFRDISEQPRRLVLGEACSFSYRRHPLLELSMFQSTAS